VDKPLKSVMHGLCDTRPMVAFSATEHHCPLTGTSLYCLVMKAYVCQQLALGCYLKWRGYSQDMNPHLWVASSTPSPLHH